MDLKMRICAVAVGFRHRLPFIRLIRDGFVLPDLATLTECGVTHESILHVVSRISDSGEVSREVLHESDDEVPSLPVIKVRLIGVLLAAKAGDHSSEGERLEFSRCTELMRDPDQRAAFRMFGRAVGAHDALELMGEAGGCAELMWEMVSLRLCRRVALALSPVVQVLVNDPTMCNSPIMPELMRRDAVAGHPNADLELTFWGPSNADLQLRVFKEESLQLAAERKWEELATLVAGTDGPGMRVRAAMEDPGVLDELVRLVLVSEDLMEVCGRVLRGERPRADLLADPLFSAWYIGASHFSHR
jgi:hypothetical protein